MSSIPSLGINGAVATIALNRPEHANRLEPADLAALQDQIALVNDNPEILVLRLTSTGKYFCSGYDISQIAGDRRVNFAEFVDAIETARPVTIASLQGGVYGGATDMALACDFRIGSTACDMFMPAVRLGLHFYANGMRRYVSRLGLNAAKRLFLTAEKIDAQEMLRIGFLTDLTAAESLVEKVDSITAVLAGMAPLALTGMKKNLNLIAQGTASNLAIADDCALASQSRDLREGKAAWAEKRPPRFLGK